MVEPAVWATLLLGSLGILGTGFMFLYNRDENLSTEGDNRDTRINQNTKDIQKLTQTLHGEGSDPGLIDEIRDNHDRQMSLLEDMERHNRIQTYEIITHRKALDSSEVIELDADSVLLEKNDFLRGG